MTGSNEKTVLENKKSEGDVHVHVHQETVDSVVKELPDDGLLYDLADFFKSFGDSTRIKILFALEKEEMCVCDLSILLGTTVSAVSHQLKNLRHLKLVKSRREGKNIFYSLADDHVGMIIKVGLEHLKEF